MPWAELFEFGAGDDKFAAGHRRGRRNVDALDDAVGDIAAAECHVEHARQLDVVDVGGLTLDKARVFAALHARADHLWGNDCHLTYPFFAANLIALTMCWYPVQRQKLPEMPSRISCSLGFWFSLRRWMPDMIMPGVQ